ncbi:MAG: mRNA-degrading endonuclease RelE of RelBE toxin-antitoxin system [Candidatus Nanohaloarchaea archaeon]|jgi:mRNA-degrading endonuclease RelE of RelBE toxin-antitoxin system
MEVKWMEKAVEDLKGMDRELALFIRKETDKRLQEKPLTDDQVVPVSKNRYEAYRLCLEDSNSGLNHRVIFKYSDEDNTVIVVKVGRREEIYNTENSKDISERISDLSDELS